VPEVRTDLEELALQLGEALNDDVAAWDLAREQHGQVKLLLTTRDGKAYEFEGRRVEE
jgi:hypothetical protein